MTKLIRHCDMYKVESERRLLEPFVTARLIHEMKWCSLYGLDRDPFWMVMAPLHRQLEKR